jgi:hypothetical protein
MYALMWLQIALTTEKLITYITAKWSFPGVYELMCFQVAMAPE